MAIREGYNSINGCIQYVQIKHGYLITPLDIWAKRDYISHIVVDGAVLFNLSDVLVNFSPTYTNGMVLKDIINISVKNKYHKLWNETMNLDNAKDDDISVYRFLVKGGYSEEFLSNKENLLSIDLYDFAKYYDKDDKHELAVIIRKFNLYEMNLLAQK